MPISSHSHHIRYHMPSKPSIFTWSFYEWSSPSLFTLPRSDEWQQTHNMRSKNTAFSDLKQLDEIRFMCGWLTCSKRTWGHHCKYHEFHRITIDPLIDSCQLLDKRLEFLGIHSYSFHSEAGNYKNSWVARVAWSVENTCISNGSIFHCYRCYRFLTPSWCICTN